MQVGSCVVKTQCFETFGINNSTQFFFACQAQIEDLSPVQFEGGGIDEKGGSKKFFAQQKPQERIKRSAPLLLNTDNFNVQYCFQYSCIEILASSAQAPGYCYCQVQAKVQL